MRKLLEGLVEFRRTARPEVRKRFAQLALGQSPDALFIACSDSRVVPNLFASTNPGDLFVMRNIGNLVPAADAEGISLGDVSEAAAIEYAVEHLHVRNIIVCGHSECGAMKAALHPEPMKSTPNLEHWLTHAGKAVKWLKSGRTVDGTLTPHNQLSQLNVLAQLENIATYPTAKQALDAGTLALHGWYFDIGHADVYAYEKDDDIFVLIDETEASRLMERMK